MSMDGMEVSVGYDIVITVGSSLVRAIDIVSYQRSRRP